MMIFGHIARVLDELFDAVDTLVSSLTLPREEYRMTTEPTPNEPQEKDLEALANLALAKVAKNDYGAFGRNLTDKVLRQFIIEWQKGNVDWKDGTGCFRMEIEICVTPVDPPVKPWMAAAPKCLRVCVDGECVEVC